MKFTPQEFVIIESVLSQAVIPLIDIEKYQNLMYSLKHAKQDKNSLIEVGIDFNDLELLHPFFLESDFHLNELDFIVELVCKLGMSSLLETSFNKYRSLFMTTSYKYTGDKILSIIYGGVPTTVCPGDIIKKYFLPFFKKNYPELIEEFLSEPIQEAQEEVVTQPPSIELTSPVDHAVHQVFSDLPPVEESIPTPILESPAQEVKIQPHNYPYSYKDKVINNKDELNWLYKEELQSLSIELGLSSEGKKKDLIDRINNLFLTK